MFCFSFPKTFVQNSTFFSFLSIPFSTGVALRCVACFRALWRLFVCLKETAFKMSSAKPTMQPSVCLFSSTALRRREEGGEERGSLWLPLPRSLSLSLSLLLLQTSLLSTQNERLACSASAASLRLCRHRHRPPSPPCCCCYCCPTILSRLSTPPLSV